MRLLDLAQFPNLKWVSQNEPTDEGAIWSAFWNGALLVADSLGALLALCLETEPAHA